jgi:hypothetical protein
MDAKLPREPVELTRDPTGKIYGKPPKKKGRKVKIG